MYLMIKHLHMLSAMISISFFIVRAFWSVRESPLLQQKWVKISPHIIDTVLLVCALYLASFWPLSTGWIWVKVVALVAYIIVGTFAIKRGKTPKSRGLFAIAAILIFGYIVGVAVTQNPSAWLAL
ncbi:SirB2 family protein [Reinekea marina]|uniref:SirB2 family protein n=1 Tax=Reinekea marina TaxID=1310421 RepID=A0ABV7WQR3_9GAMM|nr:SirB2 family protein [Reinekea marina]MDN3648685.1 SirB2 family protein [Reinekea marina]